MRGCLCLLLGLPACAVGSPGGFDDPGLEEHEPDPAELGRVASAPGRPTACQKMDVVFVVDDSGSMREEQESLARAFPEFVSVLDTFRTGGGRPLDYRIAVTTTGRDLHYRVTGTPVTELGANGAFRSTYAMSRPWLERSDEAITAQLAVLANVGTSGPSIEMPLRALHLAFDERVKDGTNAGFLRDDALLSIVVLSDEDDCSRTDDDFEVRSQLCDLGAGVVLESIDSHAQFLDDLKGAGRWAVAAIAGPGPGWCTSSFGTAAEAKRLRAFVERAGKNGAFASICDAQLGESLRKILGTFQDACTRFSPIR